MFKKLHLVDGIASLVGLAIRCFWTSLARRLPRKSPERLLKPIPVGEFEFLEWTENKHLRHSTFVALLDGLKARQIQRIGEPM